MNDASQLRWGVLGSAWINTLALPGLLQASNGRLVAVSSRRPDVAEADRLRWGAERSYGNYDDLLADPEVDAVYIPLPNHLHTAWTIRALRAGKHVLCEKPLAMSVAEVDEIRAEAERAGRVVMEAFMYRYAPRWRRAIEMVRGGTVGDVRLVRIAMGFKQFYDSYNIRFDPAAGGGVLWDMGCYAVNMSRLVFGREPQWVSARRWVRPGETVDTTTAGLLDFGDGRMATFSVSFDHINPLSQVDIVGADGWISLQGTGMRGEPFTRMLTHRYGDEVFLDRIEPAVEEFPLFDSFTAEFEELGEVALGRARPRYGLDDARANTAVLVKLVEASAAA